MNKVIIHQVDAYVRYSLPSCFKEYQVTFLQAVSAPYGLAHPELLKSCPDKVSTEYIVIKSLYESRTVNAILVVSTKPVSYPIPLFNKVVQRQVCYGLRYHPQH